MLTTYIARPTTAAQNNILAIVILPFFGKLMGRIDPRKFSIITYSSLAAYLLFLALTSYMPYYFDFYNIRLYYTLILYIIFHGVFAATMVLLWNIGSAYFCKPEEAGTYQSIHLFLTGTRASFAPLLGIFFYELFKFGNLLKIDPGFIWDIDCIWHLFVILF